VRADHQLRKRYEAELERLHSDLADWEKGHFWRLRRAMEQPREVDSKKEAIARLEYSIGLYEQVLLADD
jgi:rubrerythrin